MRTAVAGLADLLRGWLAAPDDAVPRDGELSSSARIPLSRFYGDGGEEPGRYPFTRGRTEFGYRDEFWVMGQYSGYGTPKETNARFRRLLEAGQSGLSVALDLPTQMGLDSDHPLAGGEVGKVGTPLDTVDDLIALLDGLPLENVRQIRTTANAIGPIFAGMVIVALEELGVDEVAIATADGIAYLDEACARGLDVTKLAHRLSLFLSSGRLHPSRRLL
jgi:methylmalonyl-CoA mutase N-terminal domain/subunit